MESPSEGPQIERCAADAAALASLEMKLKLVRTRVNGVVKGDQTGFYLFGAGGLGKSFTVLSHLDSLKVSYKVFNSRMTAKGLSRALRSAPDAVHVLEDMERLTRDRDAQGVLRSALWAQPGHDRIVTWTTDRGGEERFVFRGGVVLLANSPLGNLPELRALATRIAVLELEVSDAELAALMRDLAAKGYQRDGRTVLEPAKCLEVTDYLVQECHAAGCPLNLRLLTNCYLGRLLCEAGDSYLSWQDLVGSRVREADRVRRHPAGLSQEEEKARRREILREILAQTSRPAEQLRLFQERAGGSRPDFFRLKRELKGKARASKQRCA
jgi:hypothetical protein